MARIRPVNRVFMTRMPTIGGRDRTYQMQYRVDHLLVGDLAHLDEPDEHPELDIVRGGQSDHLIGPLDVDVRPRIHGILHR